MSRPLRTEFAGVLYHVIARGNARKTIFVDDLDRQRFLAGLCRVCQRFKWRLWAYCLTDNHYQLLIETLKPTLYRGIHGVNRVYTQAFNRQHQRTGHVLRGRYKAVLVDQDRYLWNFAVTSSSTRYVPTFAQQRPNMAVEQLPCRDGPGGRPRGACDR